MLRRALILGTKGKLLERPVTRTNIWLVGGTKTQLAFCSAAVILVIVDMKMN